MNKKQIIQEIKGSFDFYRTTNLTFRNMSRSDIYPLFIATKNENFNKNLLWGAPENEVIMIMEAEKLLRQSTLNQMVAISIAEKDTGKWVGLVKFEDFKDGLEIGLWIHPDYWGSGIALSTAYSSVEVVFSHSKVNKIYCATRQDNIVVQKMAKKLNFTELERGIKQHKDGREVAYVAYMLEKKNYQWQNSIIRY
jgi:RimJ/RimL family protein N-acetyltransferase